jgi:hypothetical protein
MTQKQTDALTALLNAVQTAISEERGYWDDQHQTSDHRAPDWLGALEEDFTFARRAVGAKWAGREWEIPAIPDAASV